MKMYYNTVTDTSGNVINGATVTVYEDGGAVASIYDYLGAPISNPFLSGLNRSEGEVEFAAESGMYDIKIVHGSETDWIRNETLIDTKDLGPIGGSTPGSLTCTVFTSNGIDDNATGERVQIEDGSINLGTSGASYPITHAANDQSLELVGGGSSGSGGAVKVYGGSHATKAGDIEILSGGNVLAHWDEDNGELIISAGTGAKTEAVRVYSGGVIKCASDAIITGDAISADNTSSLGLFGGNAANTGGGIIGYGGAHATLPGDVYLVSGANPFLSWDESAGSLALSTGVGSKATAITVDASQVAQFSQTPNVNGSDVLTDDDIGDIVQGYDANTAKTDESNVFTQPQTVAASSLYVGVSDTVAGTIIVYGAGAGEYEGGQLTIHTSADYDTSVDSFFIDTYQDSLRIIGSGGILVANESTHNIDLASGGAYTVTVNGSAVLKTSDIGSLVQAYDFDTAKLDVAQTWTATQTFTSPVINTSISGTAILDEDNMASNSATQLATQQSIKAYVDTAVGGVGGDPAFKGFRYRSTTASGSLADTVYSVTSSSISGMSEEYDTDGWFDPSTGYFQPDEAGYYHVNFLFIAENITSGSKITGTIYDGLTLCSVDRGYAGADSFAYAGTSITLYLNGSSDYVKFKVEGSGDSSWNMSTYSFVEAHKVGGI